MKAKFINEKFQDESDPIKDMGIGMEKEIEKFKEFVNTDRNVIINLDDDNNLLCWAAYYNKFDIVTYMINKGADINYRNVRALHFAACANNIKLGVYLVKCGADLNLAVKESKELSSETKVGMKKIQDVLRKKVDEKFTGESDPITDLGIGMYQIYKTLKQGDLVRFKKRLDIENADPPRFYPKGGIIEINQITNGRNEDITVQYTYYKNKEDLKKKKGSKNDIWGWNYEFFKDVFEPFNQKQIYEKFSEDTDPIKDMGIGLYKGWRQKYDKKPVLTYTFFLKDSQGNEKQYKFSLFYENRSNRAGKSEDAIYFGGERLVQSWLGYSGTSFHLGNMQCKPEQFFGGADEATIWHDPKYFDKTFIDPMNTHETATISKMINELSDDWFEESIFINMIKKWINTGIMRVDHIKLKVH